MAKAVKKAAKPEKAELILAVEALCREKGLSQEMLFSAIEEGLIPAYRKSLPKGEVEPANLVAHVDRVDGSMHIYARLIVAEEVENPAIQIGLEEARELRAGAEINDLVDKEVTPKGFLRVAAQAARNRILERIREAERGKVYDEYAEKTDEIVTAVVQRLGEHNVLLDLGQTDGILDESQMIPGEELHEGDHIKVYVLDVAGSRGYGSSPQIRVSRIHPNLVKRLFEMEVPEIVAGQVTIKFIAREPGSRTKMAVYSSEPMIDPVGACVGQHGGRVERVVQELRGEKIDIIKWSDDPVEFVANALNPANVLTVYTSDDGTRSCRVTVPDNQLSLAIGKEGQNARLAAKLTGWKIDIKSQSQAAEMSDMIDDDIPQAARLGPMEYDPNAVVTIDDDTL